MIPSLPALPKNLYMHLIILVDFFCVCGGGAQSMVIISTWLQRRKIHRPSKFSLEGLSSVSIVNNLFLVDLTDV